MSIKTRQPSGRPAWPIMLIAGTEKSGKSYASAEASASDLVDRTFWIGVGEDDPDELGALDGARFEIVEHDSTYRSVLAAIEAIHAEPVTDKPHLIVLDSGTRVWDMLSDEIQITANRRAARKGREVPEDGVRPTMDLWNSAKQRWNHVLDALREHDGPVIITARLDETTVVDGEKPTKDKDWKVKAEKNLPYDVGVIVQLRGFGNAFLTGVRSLRIKRNPSELTKLPDFTVDGIWRGLGLADATPSARSHSPASGAASVAADDDANKRRAALLERLGDVCDEKRYDRADIAEQWQELKGHPLKDTNDLDGIEALIADIEMRDV